MVEKFVEKEKGNYNNGKYVMYGIKDNLLVIWKENPCKKNPDDALKAMSRESCERLFNTLDTKNNIAAYVYQPNGTATGAVLFDRDEINAAKDVIKEAQSIITSATKMSSTIREYMDITTD